MIDKLIEFSDGKLLIPLAVILVGVALVKGFFGLYRSRSSDRRDFLDLWSRSDSQSDLWLEVATRHLTGTYLPAVIIRSLMQSPQAGRALLDVAESWDFLEMDDETNQVRWRTKRHERGERRKWEWRLFGLVYLFAMSGGIYLVFLGITGAAEPPGLREFNIWIYAVFLVVLAFWCLSKADKLRTASKTVPRWLGIQ